MSRFRFIDRIPHPKCGRKHFHFSLRTISLLIIYITTFSSARADDKQQTIRCNGDDDDESRKINEFVLGLFQPHTTSAFASLIVFALLLATLGWISIFFPFVFVPKFHQFVTEMNRTGEVREGHIVRYRRGRVFNAFRWLMPTHYNCYLTVRFENGNGEQVRKEICIQEAEFSQIRERKPKQIEVYTDPAYPQSACLELFLHSSPLTTMVKSGYGILGVFLIAIAIWASFVSTSSVLLESSDYWKLWMVVLGHGVAAGLAYWGCHFGHRKRVESIMYASDIESEHDPRAAEMGILQNGKAAGAPNGMDYSVMD